MFAWITDHVFIAALGGEDTLRPDHFIMKMLPEDCYLQKEPNDPYFANKLSTFLRVSLASEEDRLVYGNERLNLWETILNTSLYIGNDPLKLAARLHGQCEMHCWAEGPNRKWLAGIMRQGRKINLFRDDEGWEDVIKHMESRDDEPVVCSYSVCDQFPNLGMLPKDFPLSAKIADDDEWTTPAEARVDAFYALPSEKRWELCMQTLRKEWPHIELTPHNWNDYYFGYGICAFDLEGMAKGKYGGHTLKQLFSDRTCDFGRKRKEEPGNDGESG